MTMVVKITFIMNVKKFVRIHIDHIKNVMTIVAREKLVSANKKDGLPSRLFIKIHYGNTMLYLSKLVEQMLWSWERRVL